MKKITTILLLTCFLVFQYARQVSYWECRLSNSFKPENEKCDCERLISEVADQSEPSPVPFHHNHFHVDESFYPSYLVTMKESFATYLSYRGVVLPVFINRIITDRIDRPPQMI